MPLEIHNRDQVMRETLDHKLRVADLMLDAIGKLQKRAVHHDDSKLSDEEFSSFAATTPKLRGLTYGSEEYKAALREIKPAIQHHYRRNRHHPEHHESGIDDMNLLDLLEMLADWKAATERHDDGSLQKSFDVNRERFKVSGQLERVLRNTARDMEWM